MTWINGEITGWDFVFAIIFLVLVVGICWGMDKR
jgi:hypothetical protein